MNKICKTCDKLGRCKDATIDKIRNCEGCGDWVVTEEYIIQARQEIIQIAGETAYQILVKPVKGGKNVKV